MLAAAALLLAAATFVVGRDVWPGPRVTELLGLVALICLAPFAVAFAIAFAAGRRRDAVAIAVATQDPSPRSPV